MVKGRKHGGLIFSAEELEGKCYEILWNIAMVTEDTYFFNMLYELLQDFASHVFKLHLLVGLPLSVLYQGLFLTTGFE